MAMSSYMAAVSGLYEHLHRGFPQVAMRLEHDVQEHQADLRIDIPVQPGLPFPIDLNLRGDELYLSAGGFWRSLHPCDREDVLEWFREVVSGLLSGSHRILE
jgi:hypothetical protein